MAVAIGMSRRSRRITVFFAIRLERSMGLSGITFHLTLCRRIANTAPMPNRGIATRHWRNGGKRYASPQSSERTSCGERQPRRDRLSGAFAGSCEGRRRHGVSMSSTDSVGSAANAKSGRSRSPSGVASATSSPPCSMARARRSSAGIVSAPRTLSLSVARSGSNRHAPKITPAGGPSSSSRGRRIAAATTSAPSNVALIGLAQACCECHREPAAPPPSAGRPSPLTDFSPPPS